MGRRRVPRRLDRRAGNRRRSDAARPRGIPPVVVYRFDDWDAFVAAAKETRPHWRSALEERLRAGMREQDGAIVAASDKRAAAAAWHGLLQEQPSSAHEALGRSGVPVLLVVASESDTRVEVERFRAAVPTVEITEVASGHDLLADAPEETIALVSGWLLDLD